MASLLVALSGLCAPLFAQSDGVTVTVSRNANLNADEVYFAVAVVTDPGASLDDVLKAAQGTDISAQGLMSINLQQYGPAPNQYRLAYAFGFTVAFSKYKDTNDKLSTARRTMATLDPPMDLQIYGIGISPSETSRVQARQQLLAPLLSDARARANEVAQAAGVTLGNVVSVTEAWAVSTSAYYGMYGPIGPSTLNTPFSLTVRFAVK